MKHVCLFLLQVSKDDKLTVKWLDGSSYIGTVIKSGEAVAKVQPVGFPKEYTLWITSDELVRADVDKDFDKDIDKDIGKKVLLHSNSTWTNDLHNRI